MIIFLRIASILFLLGGIFGGLGAILEPKISATPAVVSFGMVCMILGIVGIFDRLEALIKKH